jgi:hypothetical protein
MRHKNHIYIRAEKKESEREREYHQKIIVSHAVCELNIFATLLFAPDDGINVAIFIYIFFHIAHTHKNKHKARLIFLSMQRQLEMSIKR